MLGSSIKTAVSWANVSCNTSSSFSPSASAFSAGFPFPVLFCAVDKAGIPSFLSLSFCKNFTSSNANLQIHQINQRPKLSNYPSSQLKKTHTTKTNKSPKNCDFEFGTDLRFSSSFELAALLWSSSSSSSSNGRFLKFLFGGIAESITFFKFDCLES